MFLNLKTPVLKRQRQKKGKIQKRSECITNERELQDNGFS